MGNNDFFRRDFLKLSAFTAASFFIGTSSIFSRSPNVKKKSKNHYTPPTINFDQQPLPYAYNALEDCIDAQTMEIHYTKHAAGYAKNLKEAAISEKVNMNESIEKLLSNISNYSIKLKNNAGGHYNHELFWQCMRPKSLNNLPEKELLANIIKNFGSFENFKSQFSEAGKGRFGSGWVWLIQSANGKLSILSTANQENPLMNISSVEQKGTPLLCLDVWEHAYYLKYHNKRADYINNWWNLVNWDFVATRHFI